MFQRLCSLTIFSREKIGYSLKSYAPLKPKAYRDPPEYVKDETRVMFIHTTDTEFGPGWAVFTDDVVKYTKQRRNGKYESVEIRKDSVIKWK